MRRFRAAASASASVVLALSLPTSAQPVSLADAARLAALQRRAQTAPSPVYTNREVRLRPSPPAASGASGGTSTQGAVSLLQAAAVAAAAATPQVEKPTPVASSAPPAPSATSPAPAPRPYGRISFFTNISSLSGEGGPQRDLAEYVTNAAFRSADTDVNGIEYALDTRAAAYSTEGRDARVSIYDAWAGVKLMDGALRVRGGHMWITELGGLGAIAGGLAEYRVPLGGGRLRVGGFGGLEPLAYETGYVQDVRRYGAYAAFDTASLRRHVVGYVLVKDATLIERSVLSSTNYLPIGRRVFVYQALEYDLQGPGNQGSGGLTYFFTNARATVSSRLDLQGTYHRGRSIDTRAITLDQLSGRPVPIKSLEGLLFESIGGRATVTIVNGLRVYGGYGLDRNNRDSERVSRLNAGAYANNLFGSGVDASVSLTQIDRGTPGRYDSWYVSVGRSIGSRMYVTGDYSSSLSVLRLAGVDGFLVESRPETRRFSGTMILNLGRVWSVLSTVERTNDGSVSENRLLAGLTYRLP